MNNRSIFKFFIFFVLVACSLLCLIISGCDSKITKPGDLNTPQNLELEKITSTTVRLSWTYLSSTDDTIQYIVAKKEGNQPWQEYYAVIMQKNFTDNINTNDSLVYAYKIRAYNESQGEFSSYSNAVAYFSDISKPADLEITQTTPYKLKLTWEDNSIGEEGFAIDKKVGNNSWQENYYRTPANATSFSDSTELFEKFQYRVSAFFGDSYSQTTSNEITPNLFPPENPQLTNLDNSNIRINWTDTNAEEDGFIIDRKIGHSDWQLDYADVGANVTTFVDDIYYPCATYSYRIKTYSNVGDTTFISAYSPVQAIDVRLNLTGNINTAGYSKEVCVLSPHSYERYAMIADYYNGLEIVDCINPSQPVEISNVPLPDRTISVFTSEKFANMAYAIHRNGELTIIDILDINNPTIIDTCHTGGVHNDIEVSGNYAYVADGDIGLSIIIISGPPHLITTQAIDGNAKAVSLSGNYAYVATGLNGGVTNIDISSPSYPQILSSLDFAGNALGLSADSSYVYLANGARGLEIIGVSNPSSPQHIANCPTEGYVVDIKKEGDFAYAIDTEKGLIVFDISDKSNPFILAIKALETEPTSIDISGSYAFITDNEGLKIYQINE
ncbi:MAG: hypothetical protein KGY75_09690 [Candidatus Cloacimonetes bacterium]|nr:hypothetical protein [Candidatus Cloacimonadota bacterium]